MKMFEKIMNAEVRMSGEKMHQTDRNKLRTEAMADIMHTLKVNGIECDMVRDGIAVNIPHSELGAINFVIDVKMKGLDYEYDYEVESYAAEVAEKAEVAREKAEAKAKKVAADKARRAEKEAMKQEQEQE